MLGYVLLTVLVVGVLLLAPPARRAYEALLLIGDLAGRPLPAFLDARPDARRRSVEIEGDEAREGHLYRPEGRTAAGIVLVPGAAQAGRDDPRVVAFATALARARFAVLVPDVVALRELRLLPESKDDIADALAWMLVQPGMAPRGRLGLVTTSVAIGPGLLAVLEPQLSEAVRFVVAIGGYHDLPRTLTYLTTGHYQAHGLTVRAPPREHGKWVYALSNAARLEDPDERSAFEALAWRRLRNPSADVSDLVRRLGPAGRAAYELIVNTDPARAHELLSRLPRALRRDLGALDLSARELGGIQARVLLVHGIDDDMIPYGESLGLAEALPPGQARVFLLEGFHHVDMEPGLVDGWRLWRAAYALLRERSR